MPLDVYGSDFDGVGPGLDFTNTIATTTGPRVVLLACVRRLTHPRGHFPWSPDRGFDLRGQLGRSGVTAAFLERNIVEQYEQDERVVAAEAKVVEFLSARYRIEGSILLPEGPFPHVLSVDELTIELLNEV